MTPTLILILVIATAVTGVLALCGMKWILYGHPFPSYERRMTVLLNEVRDKAIKENNEDAVKIADVYLTILNYKK